MKKAVKTAFGVIVSAINHYSKVTEVLLFNIRGDDVYFFKLGVAGLKLFRNKNKNNFAFISYKFLANLCKSSEILEQCHVKLWLKY